ncbi:MAG: uridine kinase [Flavobacteriales bacterium]
MSASVYLIGIAGGSGSGKTTFLRELLSHFTPRQVALVSQDNYYKPKHEQPVDENGVENFDLPESIDREKFVQHMQQLSSGQPIELLEYNFNNPAWEPEVVVVRPAPVIIMEGLFVFHYGEIGERLDYKVFIDAHHDERLKRRLYRDEVERGYPAEQVHYQWVNHVRPAEVKYLEPHVPQCDLVVDNNTSFAEGLDVLVSKIKLLLP